MACKLIVNAEFVDMLLKMSVLKKNASVVLIFTQDQDQKNNFCFPFYTMS